jgi:TonB-linked SusC/RagA family outer membrane protein
MKKIKNYYERNFLELFSKKTIRVMKMTMFLSLLTVFQLMAVESYSQLTKLTLKLENTKIADALREIENQSEFYFLYSPKLIDVEKHVNINADNETIKDILGDIFDGEVKFAAYDRQIILTPNEISSSSLVEVLQQGQVTGKITDAASGEAMPGVNIQVKGTTFGTITDAEGKYSLSVTERNATLVFSFIGYITQEIPLSGRASLDVFLVSEMKGLDEVIVIGYGTQKKVNVIGSVTQITTKDMTVAPVARVSNMLAGRLPGAIFMQGSGNPGDDAATIRIRGNATLGSNSPLIVVDGITDRDINSLNPDDIESISVLKDASAAIYGARAANGVILVTTKRGALNTAPTFTYRYTHGFLSPTKIVEMTDAETYATMIREYQSYKGTPEASMRYSLDDIAKYKSGEYPWTHPNTDWFDAVFKDYSNTQNHSLSINGGSQNVSYFVSYGHQSDDGLYEANSTNYKRHNLKANIDIKINEFLSFALDLTGIQENRNYSTYSGGTYYRPDIEYTLYDLTTRMWPTSPAFWPNGLPGPDFERGSQPVVISSDVPGFDRDKRYYSNNMFSATFKIPWVTGLSLTGQYAYDVYYRRNKYFNRPYFLYYFDKDAYLAAGNTGKEDGSEFLIGSSVGVSEPYLIETSSESHTKTPRIRLDYRNTFAGAHNIDAFVAFEQSEDDWETFTASRRYFLSDQLPYLFAGGDEEKTNGSSVGLDARMNYFGRVSYDYKGTYLLQFSLRRDGSLRFSKESGRWGTFPSVLLGWRMSNEEWWQNSLDFIDFFKLKASWGQMGNDDVSAFQYLTMYRFSTGTPLGTDRTYEAALSPAGTPNPLITWEVANIYNFGWESMFFKKLTFNTDFFYERRNNILVERSASVPVFTGLSLPDENFGIVDSKGFELVLGYNDTRGDFSYSINGNLNFARNKIIEFDEPAQSVEWQVRTGLPQGALLLYKWIGIFDDEDDVNSYPHVSGAEPGDLILEDYNGDEKIDGLDRQLFPLTATPELTFGLNLNLKYRNWEFSTLIQGHGRAWRRLDTNIQRGLAGNYFMRDATDRWTPENTDGSRPRAFNWNDEYWRSDDFVSTYFYDDVSFARVKNLQLSYTIPGNVLKYIRAKDARVYFSGQNLFTLWSAQDFTDPEQAGVSSYPLQRILSLGAQISF